MSFNERIEKLNQVTRGWINYFKHASINQKLADIDGWLRIKQSESRIPIKFNNDMSKLTSVLHLDRLEETRTGRSVKKIPSGQF